MRLYLVRHGKASKDAQTYQTDEERPLTKRGRADVDRIALLVGQSGAMIHQIRHSGLLRAQETAEIFARHLKPIGGTVAVQGLLFDDPVDTLARDLALETEPVMLVGHNPFMERLTSHLLTGSEGRLPVLFSTSSTVCLEYLEGVWSVRWALSPEIVGGGE